MTTARNDLGILDEFEFEVKPVGVKYLTRPLQGTAELDENLTLCEMLKAAFEGNSLREMPWIPRPYQPDGLEYVKRLRIKLGLDRS